MEWIIGGIVVIAVFAFAQMAGNKVIADTWQILPREGRTKTTAESAPTTLEIATLVPGSRVVAFIQCRCSDKERGDPFAQANFDVTVGPSPTDPTMMVTAAYNSLVWVSDSWAASGVDRPPPVGTLFHIPALMIDHVYAPGDPLHVKAG